MKADAELLENLKEIGWQIVLIPEDEEGPGFAFTLGLYHSFQHPEVLIMGLSMETMHQLLNNIGSEVKNGQRYIDGNESPDIIEGYNCTFRQIHRQNYHEFLGSAIGFYQNEEFSALQCVWPDKQGLYPWQQGFNEQLAERQWLLFEAHDGS